MKNRLLVLLILAGSSSVIYGAGTKKENKKVVKQQKAEEKLDLRERITLVLKYGNTSQVKDSIVKINTLKEDEQKSLIPELRRLILNSTDPGLKLSIIQLIGEVKWKDLDNDLIPFLKSEDSTIITTAAMVMRKKNINAAIEPLKEILLKADYSVENRNLNDLINAYAGFKDTGLQSFMFEKLQDENVLGIYKSFILKYLGSLPSAAEDVKKYLLGIANDEKKDLGLRISSVKALGNMNYTQAREPLRKILDTIETMTDKEKKKEYFFLRLELISTLVKLNDPEIKSLLIEMTRDDDEMVRIRAIRKLANFKSRDFVDLLEYKAKYDNSLAVQKEAKKALEVIQGKSDAED
jgi:HEAT repeat protein